MLIYFSAACATRVLTQLRFVTCNVPFEYSLGNYNNTQATGVELSAVCRIIQLEFLAGRQNYVSNLTAVVDLLTRTRAN
jgi:hypothetical protein